MLMYKVCIGCKSNKHNTLTNFRRVTSNGGSMCITCLNSIKRRDYSQNRIKTSKHNHRFLGQLLKIEALKSYGGCICACCKEIDVRFLTIDHINNNGSEHRRANKIHSSIGIYRWLKQNNYPKGYQVLCFQCNTGRHVNGGICPHLDLFTDNLDDALVVGSALNFWMSPYKEDWQ